MTTSLDPAPSTTQAPAAAAAPQTLSILSLVLGLSSLVFGQTFIVPAAAIVLGIIALRREPAGRTMAIWGIVTGAIMFAGVFIIATVGLAVLAPIGGVLLSTMFW